MMMMARTEGPQTHHDDPEPGRSKAPPWRRWQLSLAPGAIHGASEHEGSKPRYTHLTDVNADAPARRAHAAAWAAEHGKPLPPHMRTRTAPVKTPAPMTPDARYASYRTAFRVSDRAPVNLTRAQRRRIAHKAGFTAAQRAALR